MTAPKRRLSVVVLTAVVAALPASAAEAYSTHYTDLPELRTATVVTTTTAAEASEGTPAGTSIAFRFDEPLDASSPDASMFAVYDEQGRRSTATEASVSGETVTALFSDIDTAEEEAALMKAASAADAVHDADGAASPIGSAGLTRWTSKVASGPQDCLRLGNVGPLRHRHGNTTTRVAFPACTDSLGFAAHGFRLQMVDGRSIRSLRVRPVAQHPQAGVVVFSGLRAQSRIARLTVATGAVGYSYYDGGETQVDVSISLQAHTMSHHGNTVHPDLVSVQLQPDAHTGRPDHALFVFDQSVSRPVAGRFRLDDVVRGTRAVVLSGHPRQVRVTFAPQAASTATFATVRAGAVPSGQADEVGVPNVLWSSRLSRETTALPDAYDGVSLRYDDSSGRLVLTAAFDFDTTLGDSVTASGFHLYDAAGSRYDADQCTVTNHTNELGSVGIASCTFPSAPAWGRGAHTATVDANAVHDQSGLGNPEAAGEGYLG